MSAFSPPTSEGKGQAMRIYADYDSKEDYPGENWHELIVIVSVEDRLGTMRVVGGPDGRMDVYGNLTRADWEEATQVSMMANGHWTSTTPERFSGSPLGAQEPRPGQRSGLSLCRVNVSPPRQPARTARWSCPPPSRCPGPRRPGPCSARRPRPGARRRGCRR